MRGFTLVEMLIVLCIVGIGFALIADPKPNKNTTTNYVSDGNSSVNDTQSICVSGYKFVNGKQLISETGTGVSC